MALLPAKYKFTIWRGSTFRKRITLLEGDVDSEGEDLSAYTAALVISDAPSGGVELLTLSTTDGSITLGSEGTIDLLIEADDTDALTWTIGYYELFITAPGPGDTDALLYGNFVVRDF